MKISKRAVLALIIAFGVAGGGISTYFIVNYIGSTGNGSNGNGSEEKSIDTKIQELMADYKIPSLAAGILINNSIVWANGFGDQSSLDTVYMIGSITKTFTATAILQLKDNNLVNIDEDINNYLKFEVRNPNYPSIPITPRMLLTHTSGIATHLYWSLEYYFDNQTIQWINENLDLGGDIIQPWTNRPSLEEFLNESLNPAGQYYDAYNYQYEPGLVYSYSNAGFELLACLVEQVTNKSMTEYVQENIFEPLNMSSTGYNYTDFNGKNAIPYEWHNNKNFEYPIYNFYLTGAGALRSTVSDMSKYMIAHMNEGEYNGSQLLNPTTVLFMHNRHVPLSGPSDGFNLDGYGLGWLRYQGGLQGHGGATPGFSSNMFIKETEQGDFGVIVMYNRGSALTYDGTLIYSFLPAINNLLVDQAEILL